MKNLYNTIIAALLSSVLISSCKQEYLDTIPNNATSPETVFETTANAKLAINGLSRLMKRQYLSSQGFNGEGTIKMYYGNYGGNHFSVPLPGWSSVTNLEYLANPQSTYTYYPWYYYYTIIGNANTVLQNIDNASGPENEKQFIRAQALTFRAYAYTMLAQVYGDRWSSSNNGSTPAVVLRVMDGIEELPLSTLAETYELIYDDLQSAINLYETSGLNRTVGKNYEVNLDVAHAIFARASLNREDFVSAETHAKLARAAYPLMSNAEYTSGFSSPNKEWIWSVFDTGQETIYFYSFAAYIAYNSTASAVRNSPKSISKDLYERIPSTDIRKNMFLDPVSTGLSFSSSTGQGNNTAVAYIRSMYTDIPSNSQAYAYMQFKFKANEMPGVADLNTFRSSEMLLIEAEAKHRQGKPASEVHDLLYELNRTTGRDASYSTTATGDILFLEIKKYRAIELWGEGFDFFDMKRWGDSINRTSFANGGNFQTSLAVRIEAAANNNWKVVTPARETDYNSLIN